MQMKYFKKMKGFYTVHDKVVYKNGELIYQCYYHKPLSLEQEKEVRRIAEEYYKQLSKL